MRKRIWRICLTAGTMVVLLSGCGQKVQDDGDTVVSVSEQSADGNKTTGEVEVSGTDKTASMASEVEADTNARDEKDDATKSGSSVADSAMGEGSEEIDYLEAYREPLTLIYNILINPQEADWDYENGTVGVWEAANYSDYATAEVGYTFRDISGDGIKELLVGSILQETEYTLNQLYCIYTLVEDTPQFVIAGWGRSNLYLLEDNSLYNNSSSGWAYSESMVGKLSEDGSTYICEELYYTGDDVKTGGILYYYNTTGALTYDDAEQIEMEEDAFWEHIEKNRSRRVQPELTSFEEFRVLAGLEGSVAFLPVEVYAGDAYENLSDIDLLIYDDGEYSCKFVIEAYEDITALKLLALKDPDVDGTGEVHFKSKDIVEYGDLGAGSAVAFQVTFAGDFPNHGISLVDGSGSLRKMAIWQSGEDGSLYLQEFEE